MGSMKRAMLIVAVAALTALPAFADSFTTSSSFAAAISGMSGITTATFDGETAGNYANGSTLDGITFSYTPASGTDSLAVVSFSEFG